jgi:pimeloyl-ACP methyl ester carboxylesterase
VQTLRVPVDIGEGAPVVMLHGFAMTPQIYSQTAQLLAPRARVVIPDLFALRGRWRYERVLDAFTDTLDDLGLERVSMIGHSFGGGIELGFAAANPSRAVELVFSDTLAVSREWGLADEALRHPLGVVKLATPSAVGAFGRSWMLHPRQMVGAAWWGFTSGRGDDIGSIARAKIPAHVMWANRDSVLSSDDGRSFARQLHASFTVAEAPDGRPVDHDWMFQEPELFVSHLDKLGLVALEGSRVGHGRA